MTWAGAPGVLSALDEIARVNPAMPGAELVYEGAAKVLLGSLVGTATASLPESHDDRVGVLAAIELANARWREGASQEEAASVAGMGLTKFKRLFRNTTGSTWSAYLTARRMREARVLLASGKAVAEAARKVGYHSPHELLSSVLKGVRGVSPPVQERNQGEGRGGSLRIGPRRRPDAGA